VRGGADNKIYTFAVAFDPDYNWNSCSDDPNPDQDDLRWTAAHEFGHVVGYSHHGTTHTTTSRVPRTARSNTMCSTVRLGQTWGRTLENHDVHTFTDPY